MGLTEREGGDRTELHRGQGRSVARAPDTLRGPGEARPERRGPGQREGDSTLLAQRRRHKQKETPGR